MKTILLDKISLKIDIEELLKSLHIKKEANLHMIYAILSPLPLKLQDRRLHTDFLPLNVLKMDLFLSKG